MKDRSLRETTSGSTGSSRPPAVRGSNESGFYRVGGTGRRTSRIVRDPAAARADHRTSRRRFRRGRDSGSTPEERRFAEVYAADRAGPMLYPNQTVPDVALARTWVRSVVDDLLPERLDDDTQVAVDDLIASWAAGWLARVDGEQLDRDAVVDGLVGGAHHRLAAAEAAHEWDEHALDIAREDHARARELLRGLAEEIAARRDRRWRWLRWLRRWWRRS